MEKFIQRLREDYKEIRFVKAEGFYWSPTDQAVAYNEKDNQASRWVLLHELAHAVLGHQNYETDFELLLMESAAWDTAKKLAKHYKTEIDEDHIQDCLDTYRDWLHRRSTCPTCGNRSLQENARQYSCFNCGTEWQVSASRFCRPYRMIVDHQSIVEEQDQKRKVIKNAFF